MGALVVVIPLAAMVLPIALILIAVLVDLGAVSWAAYRWWHDDCSPRLGHYVGTHLPMRHHHP